MMTQPTATPPCRRDATPYERRAYLDAEALQLQRERQHHVYCAIGSPACYGCPPHRWHDTDDRCVCCGLLIAALRALPLPVCITFLRDFVLANLPDGWWMRFVSPDIVEFVQSRDIIVSPTAPRVMISAPQYCALQSRWLVQLLGLSVGRTGPPTTPDWTAPRTELGAALDAIAFMRSAGR